MLCCKILHKKVTGKDAEIHYCGLQPEYSVMSRKPGIGANWLHKYSNDVYSIDGVVKDNFILQPPRYYDKLFEVLDELEYKNIKKGRWKGLVNDPDFRQLKIKKIKMDKKIENKLLIRGLENGNQSI